MASRQIHDCSLFACAFHSPSCFSDVIYNHMYKSQRTVFIRIYTFGNIF